MADMLHLAEKYKVGSLKKACENCLIDDLEVENAVNTIILVDRWELKRRRGIQTSKAQAYLLAPGLKKATFNF